MDGPGDAAALSFSGVRQDTRLPGLRLAAGAVEGSFESAARDMGHEFVALGAIWRGELPEGSDLALDVRCSPDGEAWALWQPLVRDDTAPDSAPPDQMHSELLFGTGRHIQLRAHLRRSALGVEPTLRSLKIVVIDPGSSPAIAGAPAAAASSITAPPIISRAGWGANESWMTWEPAYAPVSHVVVHHTATSNTQADSDPSGLVRSIYYYHAVYLGWGDIGYNFLVDRQGRIYEGRFGGEGVIGGHARPYNTGTIGIAALGTYTSSAVPLAAVAGLERVLAWKCDRHGINPLGTGWLRDRDFPYVMGHRDCNATACPGDNAYGLLPSMREDVATALWSSGPQIEVVQPAPGAAVSGAYRVTWKPSPQVTAVTVSVDGQARKTIAIPEISWPWNTTTETQSSHRVQVTARNALGQTSAAEVQVQVDNTPPTGSLAAPALTNRRSVDLALACQGCTQMQLGAGWRWEEEALRRQTGSVVADAAAGNGKAYYGRPGVDARGAWYGPYFCGLPFPGDYEGVFWLRSGRNDLPDIVARLDVTDQAGTRYLAEPVAVAANDFATVDRYQPFTLRFHYPDRGTSCRGTTPDGLELRTSYQAVTDLWLDRVEIFQLPQPFAPAASLTWAADGKYTVDVRYKDAAGNVSPVYSRQVTVDSTPPAWGQPSGSGLPVSDAVSGLVASAAYATSNDGVHWGAWVPLSLQVQPGNASGLVPAQPSWAGRCVRARVQDQAGSVAWSPPIRWPSGAGPAPSYCWWETCGLRYRFPLVFR